MLEAWMERKGKKLLLQHDATCCWLYCVSSAPSSHIKGNNLHMKTHRKQMVEQTIHSCIYVLGDTQKGQHLELPPGDISPWHSKLYFTHLTETGDVAATIKLTSICPNKQGKRKWTKRNKKLWKCQNYVVCSFFFFMFMLRCAIAPKTENRM